MEKDELITKSHMLGIIIGLILILGVAIYGLSNKTNCEVKLDCKFKVGDVVSENNHSSWGNRFDRGVVVEVLEDCSYKIIDVNEYWLNDEKLDNRIYYHIEMNDGNPKWNYGFTNLDYKAERGI